MKTFIEYRKQFSPFYKEVAKQHRLSLTGNHGHGIDHDVTVAQLAVLISPNERIAELTWIAGMLHSMDHLVGKSNVKKVVSAHLSFLPKKYLSNEEKTSIEKAVVRHDERNAPDQDLVQQVLQDADRLANLQLSVFIRAGQYRPSIPVLELQYLDHSNPLSTYENPKSIIDGARIAIRSYMPQFRVGKAKKMAKEMERNLQRYLTEIKYFYDRIGLSGIHLP